jgi:hypothetical protein
LSRVPIREPCERLEPYEGKLSCTVLRGGVGSNDIPLPDQIIQNKQNFISQIMTSKSPARSCEDIDDTVLTYAEVKALATGDPRIKEKMDLDIQVTKLKMQKSGFLSQHYALEDRLATFYPEAIQEKAALISALESDRTFLQEHPLPDTDHFSITVRGMAYADKKEAGTALIKECGKLNFKDNKAVIGEYAGFSIQLQFDPLFHNFHAALRRQAAHMTEIGEDPLGNITRLNNALKVIPQRLETQQQNLDMLNRQKKEAEEEIKKTWPKEAELREKASRLNFLTKELSAEKNPTDAKEPDEEEALPLPERLQKASQGRDGITGEDQRSQSLSAVQR